MLLKTDVSVRSGVGLEDSVFYPQLRQVVHYLGTDSVQFGGVQVGSVSVVRDGDVEGVLVKHVLGEFDMDGAEYEVTAEGFFQMFPV